MNEDEWAEVPDHVVQYYGENAEHFINEWIKRGRPADDEPIPEMWENLAEYRRRFGEVKWE